MGVPAHNLDDLEQRRLTLEENILQLQKSLYHWRTWEAEYDGLREEIDDLPESATTDDFLNVGRDLKGSVVTEEELNTIVGTRSRDQVVDLLGRRMDYVKQNISTMEKRLRTAQVELDALDKSESLPADRGADFPMREIMEELDENGDVVSSSVNTPGAQAPELLEVLKKVGVENVPEQADAGEGSSKGAPAPQKNDITPDTGAAKPETDATPHEPTPEPATEVNAAQEEELDLSKPVSIVTDEDRKQASANVTDESEDDAQLRREMLQYGINEVGAIVAELELDEEASDVSFDEDYTWATDEEDEEEDEFGRTRTELTDDYHHQMRELEAKLNARGMWNMGKDTQTFPSEVQQEINESTPVEETPMEDVIESSSKGKKPKKRVAFADDLDIAPAPKAPQIEQIPTTERRTLPPMPETPPLAESIVERTDQSQDTKPSAPAPPKKASRFKSARSETASPGTVPGPPAGPSSANVTEIPSIRTQGNAANATSLPLFPAKSQAPKPFSTPIIDDTETRSGPQPPEGKTLADKLVEREVKPGNAQAPEADELDESIHRREIATEFYKMRNRMVQQNGGFLNDEEPEMIPIETEEPPKKISKFMAARMK